MSDKRTYRAVVGWFKSITWFPVSPLKDRLEMLELLQHELDRRKLLSAKEKGKGEEEGELVFTEEDIAIWKATAKDVEGYDTDDTRDLPFGR